MSSFPPPAHPHLNVIIGAVIQLLVDLKLSMSIYTGIICMPAFPQENKSHAGKEVKKPP
jgi:hypothetical protein